MIKKPFLNDLKMKIIKYIPHLILCFMSFLLLMVLYNPIKRIPLQCLGIYDFGIYLQAIYELSRFEMWNPCISIRQTPVFGDHLGFIQFLPAFIIKIIGYSPLVPIYFEWTMFFLMFVSLYFILDRPKLTSFEFLTGSFLILFSRGLMMGMEFPVHPGTWAMLPIFWWVWAILKGRINLALGLSVFLCLYRETFYFLLFSSSFALSMNRGAPCRAIFISNLSSLISVNCVFTSLIKGRLLE